jgi:hypothetical protein
MAKSNRASRVRRKKPGPAKTTGPGEQVVVRLHDPLLGKLDEWRQVQKDTPTRAEALRRLAGQALGHEPPGAALLPLGSKK